jgi:hypothetical protein
METAYAVRTLLQSAPPLSPPPPDYYPPDDIAANADKFYDRVRRPPRDWHEDDAWFEHHWEWLGPIRSDGQMFIHCRSTPIPVHRFIWLLNNGPVPEGLYPRPICGERQCVSPYHLRLRERGARLRTLNEKAKRDIKWLFHHNEPRVPARRLAAIFGVSEQHIYRVANQPDA